MAGNELWKSDGTAAGTVLVKDIVTTSYYYGSSSYPSGLTAVGGTLFFTAVTRDTGTELWKSDGTAAGTVLVKDINTDTFFGNPVGSNPGDLAAVGGVLLFRATD